MNTGKQIGFRFGWDSPEALSEHEYIEPRISQLVLSSASSGALTILDVGCGNGYIASRLAENGHQVIGLDISEDGIEIARKAYPHIRFEVLSAYDDLKEVFDEVDLIVSSEVIEHLYSPKIYLQNCYSVLRPGGVFILTTPYHGYLKNLTLSVFNMWDRHLNVDWDGGHIKFFSQKTLVAMLVKTGFRKASFHNVGRIPFLWKSMVCRVEKPGLPETKVLL